MTNFLTVRDKTIFEDVNGNLCLTDIWRAAGAPSAKTPPNWRQLPTTDEYIAAVAENLGKSYDKAKNDYNSVVYSRTGRRGGTFGHILVAIAYGEYLNPDLAVEIKTTYLALRTGDLSVVGEILAKAEAAREFQEHRDVSKSIRERYEKTIATHGGGIGESTNAIYKVLLGGTKQEIATARRLPKSVLFRDKMSTGELLQTMSSEHLATERIEELNLTGRSQTKEASRRSATIVKEAFDRERKDRTNPETDL